MKNFNKKSHLSTASWTSFFFVLSQDDGGVRIGLRPVRRGDDLEAHLAVDVGVWSHKGAESVQSPSTSVAREAALVVNFVLDRHLFGLVDGSSTSD